MLNFVDALQHWNTRPIWKNCSRAAGSYTALLTTLAFLLLLSVSPQILANAESRACSQALASPLAPDKQGLNHRLRVLVWNIEKAGNPGWDHDLSSLGTDSDLLLIQEASVQAGIGAALSQPLYQAFAAGYTTEELETGVLTLSAVEPSLQCNLTAWEPWLGTPKATNITEYPIQGLKRRLLVINLHVVNFSVGLEEFIDQVHALDPLLSHHMGPLIVAGDFNTWSNSRTKYLQRFMLSHQLTPVAFNPDKRTRLWNKPLDHVFLRGLNLVEASAVKVKTSDHNPLLFTVEVPLCKDCTAQSSP